MKTDIAATSAQIRFLKNNGIDARRMTRDEANAAIIKILGKIKSI